MIFLIILGLVGTFVVLHAIFTAETGYEDESGFHPGTPRGGTYSDTLFTIDCDTEARSAAKAPRVI